VLRITHNTHNTHNTMNKERRTVTLDPAVDEYLDRPGVNASELVNELMKEYMNGDGGKANIREFRMRQLQSDIDALQKRLNQRKREYDQLKEARTEAEEEREQELQEAVNVFSRPDVKLKKNRQKVRSWANELDMTQEEFINAVEERL